MGPLLSGQSSKPACNLLFKFIWGEKNMNYHYQEVSFLFFNECKSKI